MRIPAGRIHFMTYTIRFICSGELVFPFVRTEPAFIPASGDTVTSRLEDYIVRDRVFEYGETHIDVLVRLEKI